MSPVDGKLNVKVVQPKNQKGNKRISSSVNTHFPRDLNNEFKPKPFKNRTIPIFLGQKKKKKKRLVYGGNSKTFVSLEQTNVLKLWIKCWQIAHSHAKNILWPCKWKQIDKENFWSLISHFSECVWWHVHVWQTMP